MGTSRLERLNQLPKHKSKSLRYSGFKIWTQVSNSLGVCFLYTTLLQGSFVISSKTRGFHSAKQVSQSGFGGGGQRISGSYNLSSGDRGQLCTRQRESPDGSGELSLPWSQKGWISSKNQRPSTAEPRKNSSFLQLHRLFLNETYIRVAPWSLVGLRPQDGGNPSAGLTYLLDWAPSAVALGRKSPPLFARLPLGTARPKGPAALCTLTSTFRSAPASSSIWTIASSPRTQAYISGVMPCGELKPENGEGLQGSYVTRRQ